jgi:hypothetical protein
MQRQQEMMRRIAADLARNPMLDMLERQRQQQDMILKALAPRHIVIDAFNRNYASRLVEDARGAAHAIARELGTQQAIQDWLERQRTVIEEAAKAREEGREFDLAAHGGPRLDHAAIQTYVAILGIILMLLQMATNDGISADEQRAITKEQTRELRESQEEQSQEATAAIDRQTEALKNALQSLDRPEIHVSVERDGKITIREGDAPAASEPTSEAPKQGPEEAGTP